MKKRKSSVYSPKDLQIAHELADALSDQKSLAFYLSCAQKYPSEFLMATLTFVMSKPAHSIRTTRARLFTSIVTKSVYNTNDHIWD
jgi:hypothetical protein